MSGERERLPDVLRGFAIVLVVLGHCIQEGSGEGFSENMLYFHDRLYQFIYSFHMPLFMMVSGYLGWGSMKRADTKDKRRRLLKARAVKLLSPIFLWTAIDYARGLVIGYIRVDVQSQAIVFAYFYSVLNNLWFLWAAFWCFIIVYAVHYFFKDSVLVYLAGFVLLFFIPDGLGLGAYKYMLPYFVVSFYGHKYIERHREQADKFMAPWAAAAAGVVFGVMFLFFDENDFIYLTGYKLVGKDAAGQLLTDFYRMFIGFAGSGFFILSWGCALRYFKCEWKALRALGTESMGIYILSGYLLVLVIRGLVPEDNPSYLLNMAEAAAVLIVSWGISRFLGKIRGLRILVGKAQI